MSHFSKVWGKRFATKAADTFEDYDAGQAETFNICAEYKDENGSTQYRFFNSDAEMQQFEQETGIKVKVMTKSISKGLVEKPEKFDRCVESVKQNNPGANSYAVCNAMLSDKSFSQMEEKSLFSLIGKALGQIGITAGGPIPNSLLARQDLEDDEEETHKSTAIQSLAARIKANQKPVFTKGSSFRDAWNKVRPQNKLSVK